MGYTAGTLDLSVLGTSESAVASIDRTVKSLNSLSRAINKFNNVQTIPALTRLENVFNRIAKVTANIDTTALSKLSIAASSLNSISKISKLETLNWDKASDGFSKLTVAITPFVNKVKEAEASLVALYGILNRSAGKKVGNLLNSTTSINGLSSITSMGKSFLGGLGRIFKITSLTAILHGFRRIGNVIGNIATKGGDFSETLNLWKVSMGQELLPQAEAFVNKLNEAYGISKQTLMNSQAIFKNMLGALGEVSSVQAYYLSEGITQMALDYASLYNVKFEAAMTKFQAALAGQVRPIRSVSGYDITENTLFEVYKQLGGTKTMRQLSQTEKRLLSIYAIFKQMDSTHALGDLKKTIDSFANQSRVFDVAWNDVQTYAGKAVTHLLENLEIMPRINAAFIFVSRLLEGIAKAFDKGLGNSGEAFDESQQGAEDLNKELEEIQSTLLDFDKFRALDQGANGNNALGIDKTILDAVSRYDTILEGAKLNAREIADAWLKSLGFVDENNDGVIDMDSSLTNLLNKLKGINWGEELGKSLASFINYINFEELSDGINNAIKYILEQAWSFAATLVVNIDWEGLLKQIANIEEKFENSIMGKAFKAWLEYMTYGNYNIAPYANGGLPDKGSMFVAGEAGAEIVYNMPSGQSGVANVQQIAQATYSGTIRALNDWWGGSQAKGDIPQLKEANATGMYQAVTGVAKSQGKVWANV